MKKIIKASLFMAVASSILFSCSMEKKHYSHGYYINWKQSHHGNGDVSSETGADVNSMTPEKEVAKVKSSDEVSVIKQEEMVANAAVNNETVIETVANNIVINNKIANENSSTPETISKNNKSNGTTVSKVSKAKLIKQARKAANKAGRGGPSRGLLFVLCFLLPWLAVGLATDWDVRIVIYNLLWSLTCLGGIIHAIIVVNREA